MQMGTSGNRSEFQLEIWKLNETEVAKGIFCEGRKKWFSFVLESDARNLLISMSRATTGRDSISLAALSPIQGRGGARGASTGDNPMKRAQSKRK